MYSYVPNSNIKLYGFEVSKAILDGTLATPALGIRGTYTRLAGSGRSGPADGGGRPLPSARGSSSSPPTPERAPSGSTARPAAICSHFPARPRDKARLSQKISGKPRVFAGLKISPLPLFGITAEAEYEVRPIYSLKAALSF